MKSGPNKIRVPRFTKANGFTSSSAKASATLRKVKGSDTQPELIFRKKLWKAGIRYRLTKKNLLGKPDLILTKRKALIFIDGDFWHGHNWEIRKAKLKANRSYWVPKIERNIQRDKEITASLSSQGWRVLRLWEHEILANSDECITKTLRFLQEANHLPI